MTIYKIPTYDGYYLTDDNRIIGKLGKPLTECKNKNGHCYVNVFVNGPKVLYVHIAVALVHKYDEYFEGAWVDHINNDPTDNHKDNLRWVTPSQNNYLNRNDLKSQIDKTETKIKYYQDKLQKLKNLLD